MPKLRVHNFAISLDGYGAGPRQTPKEPLGVGGEELHNWFVHTRTFRAMGGKTDGTSGIDNDFASRGFVGIGAWIMGRNMFGPIRGEWPDDSWRGWWGKNPPYHSPVFVLTHHAHASIPMEGGTVFHFVTGGVGEALERAFEAAAGRDVQLGGGVSTIRQSLEARLIDEMHVAIAPVLLGGGERLFDHLDGGPAGYERVEFVCSPSVVHVRLSRTG